MARLGLWDNGLSNRIDASRPFVARCAFLFDGKAYAAGDAFDKGSLDYRALRRLFMARRIAYATGESPKEKPATPIPTDYAKLPWFSLRKLAALISGDQVQDKPAALDIVHAELMRRGRAA